MSFAGIQALWRRRPARAEARARSLAVNRAAWFMGMLCALCGLCLVLGWGSWGGWGNYGQAYAQQSLPPAPYAYQQLDDPAQEQMAQELMVTLRCLKCQSQSIADSDAPMAGDMRHQVRLRIAAGEDPEAIRAWLVQRYGDYVSYTPKVNSVTWPLFVVPLVLIGLAIVILWRRLGRSVQPAGMGQKGRASGDKGQSRAAEDTQDKPNSGGSA